MFLINAFNNNNNYNNNNTIAAVTKVTNSKFTAKKKIVTKRK